ncbi:MAG: phosphomethylpyrimidine synthase ThiC [candidate division WOR-3 bacterium]|nr:phosphomethylpyrimidine synthase ThiC [candidate division WOR-3 bacterium]MCX7837309.1 phosphomethylpyrimidine synthase ThiC [candidate division WOR-3 bacterium]MDW8114677.1 phosphomethylpyrimidine synthase ThiC [candidate division WOR-3 bacterium]
MKNNNLKIIAEKEGISLKELKERIKRGEVVILKNKRREIIGCAVGKSLTTKVNANIGTSPEICDIENELKKLRAAEEAGADTIMDLSTGGDLDEIRKILISEAKIPIGSVPIYQLPYEAKKNNKSFVELKEKDFLKVIEKHFIDGIDFATIHCGINKKVLKILYKKKRICGIVSRGGSLVVEWMKYNNKENPLYEYFDDILAMAKEYDVCLSLGDGLRPGSILDATDEPQIFELLVLGELQERAREKGVKVMIEGPGHIPLNHIYVNILLEKIICNNAPFYVLGPLVSDIGLPYDHFVAGIGGALAAYYGADFLCYVTPSEHLGLPTVEDVREGVIIAKLAAHIADIAKGIKKAVEIDKELSLARARLDFEKMINLAINPQKAKEIYERYRIKKEYCTMCGEFCALKKSKELLKKE